MRCGALLAETKGSFTAFNAISTEEGWQKQTTASEFPAVQQATNDWQKRLVTAWCCFPQCWVVTWNVVLKSLCTWAMGCGVLLAPTKTKGSFTAFSAISTEEGWQKQTTASEFPAVQQATNDRSKRLVTAWCCFSQCLVLTWLLGELNMNRGWHVEIWGWKICVLANSEHVIWRILRNSAPAGEFWMIVRTLDACADFASGNMMSGKFWSNLVSPVDAPPSFPGTLSEIRVHEKTHLDTPRREKVRWDEMNCDMWLPCMQHDHGTYPRKRMTWHDNRQAGSWVRRIPYREQVQVHASMNPSTTSSIASLGNIGRWAVVPLLVPFDSGLYTHRHTHTLIYTCMHACMHTYRHTYIQTHTDTYRHIQKHTDTYRHIQTHTDTYRHIQTDIHTDIQTYKHTDIQTYRHIGIQTYKRIHPSIHTCIHTDRQTYIHTDTYRHIQTHADTYRHIQTHTDTYRHIQTHIDTYRHIQTHTDTYRHIQTHTDTYRHIQTHTDRHTYIHTDIQTYRHTDIQTYRHTDIQTYRHIGIQTYRHIHTYIHPYIHTYITYTTRIYIHTHTHTFFSAGSLSQQPVQSSMSHGSWGLSASAADAVAVSLLLLQLAAVSPVGYYAPWQMPG